MWRVEDELIDDFRWRGYEVFFISNVNYGWILYMVFKFFSNGVVVFILVNGVFFGSGIEYEIRKKFIENYLVEVILVLL